jgi:hypothetical protein
LKRYVGAVLSLALMATTILPTQSFAIPPLPAPVVTGGASGGGASAAGGIIGVAAFFVFYDLVRRTTCSGDFLGLGGPGFTTPINAGTGNVMIPQCHHVVRHKCRHVRRHIRHHVAKRPHVVIHNK